MASVHGFMVPRTATVRGRHGTDSLDEFASMRGSDAEVGRTATDDAELRFGG